MKEEIKDIEGMCCDCANDMCGFCGSWDENEDCTEQKEDGSCFEPLHKNNSKI
jgi:hypothetical protein